MGSTLRIVCARPPPLMLTHWVWPGRTRPGFHFWSLSKYFSLPPSSAAPLCVSLSLYRPAISGVGSLHFCFSRIRFCPFYSLRFTLLPLPRWWESEASGGWRVIECGMSFLECHHQTQQKQVFVEISLLLSFNFYEDRYMPMFL